MRNNINSLGARPIGVALLSVAALALTSCGLAAGGEEDKTISIIVTESAPYQEPTEIVKELLAEDGWTLDTTYVTDIIQPNNVVAQGEFDANYFQNAAYLRQFNEDNGTDVVPAFSVYYAPSGIFSLKYDSLEDLPDGAQISLPVDTANNGRGIKILADAGLLEVDDSTPVTNLSQRDITENPHNFEFIEIDQQSTAQTLPDVDAGFSFVRMIVEADYDLDEVTLELEPEAEDSLPYSIVVGVQPGNEDTEKTQVLQEAYQSEEVEEWFDDYLEGSVEFTDEYTTDNITEPWEKFVVE